MLWIIFPLSLQMCVLCIFSKLNLALLFPVLSAPLPPALASSSLDLAPYQGSSFQTVV